MGNVAFTFSAPPPSFCALSQADINTLFALISANVTSVGQFFKGDSAPTDLTQTWHRIVAGKPERDYDFVNGAWHAPHWATEGTVIMWEGALAAIKTFETPAGQENEVVSWDTGPFWKEAEELRGRSPMGPGTLPSGTVVAVTDQLGDEKTILLLENIPSHHHKIGVYGRVDVGGGTIVVPHTEDPNGVTGDTGGDASGVTIGHNTIHPVYGIFFLRKTGRTHWRI